jgi:hypothetical protein
VGVILLSFFIEENAVKDFMNRLLRESIFDGFEARTVDITALACISIFGQTESENDNILTWSEIKPLVTAVIKSGPRPRYMKIIFSANKELTVSVHENAKALFLNMTYENNKISFTTACAQKVFTLDKSLDKQWDVWVKDFFMGNKIPANEE